jgi:hypothetical protein
VSGEKALFGAELESRRNGIQVAWFTGNSSRSARTEGYMGERRGRIPLSQARFARHASIALLLLGSLVGLAFGWRAETPVARAADASRSAMPVAETARRETRPTLDPALFVGKAAAAHRAAREIPDVLDQLYCYCRCDKHLGHKSLLSCYTDGHAAT